MKILSLSSNYLPNFVRFDIMNKERRYCMAYAVVFLVFMAWWTNQ